MSTKKTTPRKAAASNRAAMDSTTKKPRIVSVDVVMDDEVADNYDKALRAFQTKERQLLESRPRRIAAVRAGFTASTTPEEQALAQAQVIQADDLELDALRAALDEAAEALDAVTVWYKFRALGRNAWEALKAKHPATEEDHQASREATGKDDDTAQWHFQTLAPELVEKACVSPKLSADDVDEIFNGENWNDQEISRLFTAALTPQVTARQNPAGRR